jgi:ribosomal protein S6
MKPYEIAYLIVPSFTTEEATTYHEEVKKIIEKNSGVLGNEQLPTKKVLAYPIKKSTEAYLASINFENEEENILKINDLVKNEKNILRFLLISKKTNKKDATDAPRRKRKSLKPEKASLKEIDEKIDEIL